MTKLLTILLVLFAVLGVLVMVLERYARPVSAETQSRMSSTIMVLVFILLVGRLLMELFGG
ncbi:hypothetical protein [Kistimonas asteriae]|uniref:hypothetical protein n=1 Tax=Kistimonas asteriae TaxID=517724 RepID=UPI001BA9A49E|nr:hypothetical protein [Kistimonas asteriae]